MKNVPSLFGLANSNRDFTEEAAWGKNQFNSSFPAALCCYMYSKGMDPVYIKTRSGQIEHGNIDILNFFGTTNEEALFTFESIHMPYAQYLFGNTPRVDLVVQNKDTGDCLSPIEIKLTAIPDNTTCDLDESMYGSEIVVRPDTIVYLACSLIDSMSGDVVFKNLFDGEDISEPQAVLPKLSTIAQELERLLYDCEEQQSSILLQPVWKTQGKSPRLADQCLDAFVWSNTGFLRFILSFSRLLEEGDPTKITRQIRTVVWLYQMIYEYQARGRFDHEDIIDRLSYNTKNDKAFAASGLVTQRFMGCPELTRPRISKAEISNIILGGGQNLLSPERRFDALIYNSEGIFD